jgi:DNA-binding transcriptional LysR family regulator
MPTIEGSYDPLSPVPYTTLERAFFIEQWAMYDWAEFRHFRYLLAILEKQGFRAAAEVLHTAQPNLSIQARQFQENASVRLFRKMRNGQIRPTETGLAFVFLSRYLLETRDEIIDVLQAIERGVISTLRFGCSPFVDPDLFRSLCSMHKELLPASAIQPTHGDTIQLAEEIAAGIVDVALVTLPLKHPELHIEELRRERLVVCLRRDHVLAGKAALHVADLQGNITVFYHPQRHPEAHKRLLELLGEAGVQVESYSRVTHPFEMQTLVKEGHGLALIREGTALDDALTKRPILGVDWTVDTAVIYHRQRYPKTIPILVKQLRRQLAKDGKKTVLDTISPGAKSPAEGENRLPQAKANENLPVQLKLLA